MSSSASVTNPLLTSYARGLAADALKAQSLVEYIAPVVETGAATGRYKAIDDKNSLAALDARRGVGGRAKRLEFNASDATYNCDPYALEIPIDDHEKKQAGDDGLDLLKQGKVAALINTQIITRENAVWSTLKAAVAATGGVGQWSVATNDPVAELDAQIEAIATKIGMMPNRIVFGLGAWRVFRAHDKVVKRFPTTAFASLRPDQAAGLFLNPNMQVQVGTLAKDTAKVGVGKNAANIIGSEVWLYYAENTPGIFDQSFAKTFRVRGDGVMGVREYRDEGARSDILAVDWTEQVKVTNAEAGARIALS